MAYSTELPKNTTARKSTENLIRARLFREGVDVRPEK
jgi:hypothetical protein